MLTRRQFIKSSSAALAALTLPGVALAQKRRIEAIPEPLRLNLGQLDEWLDLISISRRALMADDISGLDEYVAPVYELDSPKKRNQRRNARLLACSVDGQQLRYHAPPEACVPINDLSSPAKFDSKPPDQSKEFYLASQLAMQETRQLVWMCKYGAKRQRYRQPLTMAVVNDAFRQVEQWNCFVHHIIFSPEGLETIKRCHNGAFDEPTGPFPSNFILPTQLINETVLKSIPKWHPLKGSIWTADVFQTAFLKRNQFIVFSQPDTVGVHVVKTRSHLYNGHVQVQTGQALINPYLCIFGETTA